MAASRRTRPAGSRRWHLRTRLLGAVVTAVLALTAAAAVPDSKAGTAAAGRSGTLSVSPNDYYGGQGVRYAGRLPVTGVRRVWLEVNMNRAGDPWQVVESSRHFTNGAGRFAFRHPAPSMYGISVRVASGAGHTPQRTLSASDQAMTLDVRPTDGRWPTPVREDGFSPYISYPAITGERFDVTVNTASEGGPILARRRITLEQRTADGRWTGLATGRPGADGLVRFTRVAPQPGVVVYRARAERWTANRSRIGWFPSFPTYVYVLDRTGRGAHPYDGPYTPPVKQSGHGDMKPTAAGRRFGWGPMLFDFAYEWGESLTDRPAHGSRRRGSWLDIATGTGRVAKHNGGMFFESKHGEVRNADAGNGDLGTTTATLRGNALTYGRWELLWRAWDLSESGAKYRVTAELVPADPERRGCDAPAITIADLTPSVREVRFGARSGRHGLQWAGHKRDLRISRTANAYGVEVTRSHITWFVNGKVAGTLRSSAAVPDVPLTVRLSLVGDGNREMRHTYAISDWIRGWRFNNPRRTRSGASLDASTYRPSCGD